MGMAKEMKNLSDEILSSYKQRAAEFQQRLKNNAEIVKEVQKTLDGFRKDHQEMAATLRANAANLRSAMAQGQKERLTSFQQMMSGIHGSISQIQDEVEGIKISTADMLKDFSTEHDEMTVGLHKELDQDKANRLNWNTGRMKEFNNLMKGINKEIVKVKKEVGDIFGYTDHLLTNFSNAHNDMSAAMRAELKSNLTERVAYTQKLLAQFDKKLAEMSKENQKMAKELKADLQKSRKELSKSDVQRLKDFNVKFADIQKRVHEIQKFVNTFLGEFSADRKQAASTWAKLAEAIAKLEQSPQQAPVVKKQSPAPEKPAAKKETVAEKEIVELAANKTEPDVESPNNVPHSEPTLEEKVLNYINAHKNGVKVTDMEAPLGDNRMRIGFITKKLLDEGLVLKVDNYYYPLANK
jgi:hypothetical protein